VVREAKRTQFSTMIKLKDIVLERMDFQDTAAQLIKAYGLKSKVKFGTVKGTNKADYDWISDIINLRKSYRTVKDFIITVLHEINHALDAKKMGSKKYEYQYIEAGLAAEEKGGDFHDDNAFEKKAESWAIKQYTSKWKKKL